MNNIICAVVVTFNRKDKLRKCIKSILAQEKIKCDILIIDNASDDGTDEMIEREFKRKEVRYINTGSNLGGAGGFEYGIRIATQIGYDYIWIMDDDTWPKKDALYQLMSAGENLDSEWGFLSSVAFWVDGSICRANVQKKSLFKFVTIKDYDKKKCKIQFASFVSLLVPVKFIRRVGLPIGDYFIWTDDYEFTGRITKLSPGYMVTNSEVIHAMEVHKKASIAYESSTRIDRYKYLFRNDVHCYRQYGYKGYLYLIAKFLYNIMSVIFRGNGNKKEKITIIANGFKEGIRFRPQIHYV